MNRISHGIGAGTGDWANPLLALQTPTASVTRPQVGPSPQAAIRTSGQEPAAIPPAHPYRDEALPDPPARNMGALREHPCPQGQLSGPLTQGETHTGNKSTRRKEKPRAV